MPARQAVGIGAAIVTQPLLEVFGFADVENLVRRVAHHINPGPPRCPEKKLPAQPLVQRTRIGQQKQLTHGGFSFSQRGVTIPEKPSGRDAFSAFAVDRSDLAAKTTIRRFDARKIEMKKLFILLVIGLAVCVPAGVKAQTNAPAATDATNVETIVCIRHGEKPRGGLGQLTVRGLNRSLALPKVLLGKFGTPQFIFAPNPNQKSDGNKYYYIRPLATIEPTAIKCGLPVDTEFGYEDIRGLEAELAKPQYQNATVFVAWEHGLLNEFAKNMVKDNGGDVSQVPDWPGKEFDRIFVFKITTENGQKKFSFTIDHEGLNNLSDDYP